MKSLVKFKKKKTKHRFSRNIDARSSEKHYAFLCKLNKVKNMIRNKNNFLKMKKTRYLKK